MTEVVLAKGANGVLIPADQQSAEVIAKLKLGAGVRAKIKRHNNVLFHRKLFALANLAYESWEPEAKEHKGIPVAKNFDQFRDDLTILSGFYDTAIRLDGSIRFTAKSWSFDKMDDAEKDKLYNAIINVILQRVLTNYTRADLDDVVARILRFD